MKRIKWVQRFYRHASSIKPVRWSIEHVAAALAFPKTLLARRKYWAVGTAVLAILIVSSVLWLRPEGQAHVASVSTSGKSDSSATPQGSTQPSSGGVVGESGASTTASDKPSPNRVPDTKITLVGASQGAKDFDFNLNPSSITVSAGGLSPVVTARSVGDIKLDWGSGSAPGAFVFYDSPGAIRNASSFAFRVDTTRVNAPTTIVLDIYATMRGKGTVIRQLTVHVLPPPTFDFALADDTLQIDEQGQLHVAFFVHRLYGHNRSISTNTVVLSGPTPASVGYIAPQGMFIGVASSGTNVIVVHDAAPAGDYVLETCATDSDLLSSCIEFILQVY